MVAPTKEPAAVAATYQTPSTSTSMMSVPKSTQVAEKAASCERVNAATTLGLECRLVTLVHSVVGQAEVINQLLVYKKTQRVFQLEQLNREIMLGL